MDNDTLLSEIHDYCAAVGMAETTFGNRAVNDGKLVSRLRSGKTITLGTFGAIKDFMAAHPPENPQAAE